MSSTSSLTITPDEIGFNNRITIIKSKDDSGNTLDKPAYYLPVGFKVIGNLDGRFDDASGGLKVGENYPTRFSVGESFIDVVLNGSESFKNSEPVISVLDPDPVNPKTFIEYKYYSETVSYGYTVLVKEGQALPAVGSFTTSNNSRTTVVRIFQLDANIKEVEKIGFVFGSGSDYIVFNGQSRQKLPDEAQNVLLGRAQLVDINGKLVQPEVELQSGEIVAFANDNGLKKEVACFGFIKVHYSYVATRYKLNYECKDFKLIAKSYSINWPMQVSNNKDNLNPSFFIIKASSEKGFITEVFRLDKKAEFIDFSSNPSSVSRELVEENRVEEERTYEDENGLSSIKMRVVKNVTLKGQDGKEWQLKFNEPPA